MPLKNIDHFHAYETYSLAHHQSNMHLPKKLSTKCLLLLFTVIVALHHHMLLWMVAQQATMLITSHHLCLVIL